MTWDGDAERAAKVGAQRALAALGHDAATPLTALYTFLRLAKGEGLEPIRRCADRLQASIELAREVAELDDTAGTTKMALAIESAAARLAISIELEDASDVTARIATTRAVVCARALLIAVVDAAPETRVTGRIARENGRILVRIAPGIEPASWRVVEPWRSGTGVKLALWTAAVAAAPDGVVRVGERDGRIAVELDVEAT